MRHALFLAGTGTDVGKTYVAGLILKKLRESGLSAGYYKAAMSGNRRREDGTLIPGDAVEVREISGIHQPLSEMCPYVYEHPVSPHLAARMEGDPVELDRVLEGFRAVCRSYDYVTMEGSGGILCPLRLDEETLLLPQVIQACSLGCLLVADAELGSINRVVLAAFYLKQQGIPLKGILFNRFLAGDPMQEDNVQVCRQLTGAKVIACVPPGVDHLDLPLDDLLALYDTQEDFS